MRAIENTITEYPGQANGVLDKRWVYAGNTAFFVVQTTDEEILTVFSQRLTDLLHPDPNLGVGVVKDDEAGILTLRSRYTTNFDVVNNVLADLTEHFGLPPVYWTTGPSLLGNRPHPAKEVF